MHSFHPRTYTKTCSIHRDALRDQSIELIFTIVEAWNRRRSESLLVCLISLLALYPRSKSKEILSTRGYRWLQVVASTWFRRRLFTRIIIEWSRSETTLNRKATKGDDILSTIFENLRSQYCYSCHLLVTNECK